MPLDTTPFLPLGPHVVKLVGTDVVHIIWHGEVLAEHVLQLGEITATMPDRERGIFIVSDCSDIGIPGASARKAAANDPNSRWMREVVIIGATFTMRIVISMVNKAIRAIGRSTAPVTFVHSEAEATGYIGRRRATAASR